MLHMLQHITHVGYSDESNWNTGRFRSLGLISAPIACSTVFEKELQGLLKELNITEFSWKRMDSAKEWLAAQRLCSFAVYNALANKLRVDVVVWDIDDRRHKVRRRDDVENLQRMYYHLFRNVLRARWPNDSIWRLHPDERTDVNWLTMRDCLRSAACRQNGVLAHSAEGLFRTRLLREFGLEEIKPAISRETPLLQLADLFAGMAAFSRNKYNEYAFWIESNSSQLKLFDRSGQTESSSRRSLERFKVIYEFDCICKNNRLGVSLKNQRGLWTPKPENPVNFWQYIPQHLEETAPTKRA